MYNGLTTLTTSLLLVACIFAFGACSPTQDCTTNANCFAGEVCSQQRCVLAPADVGFDDIDHGEDSSSPEVDVAKDVEAEVDAEGDTPTVDAFATSLRAVPEVSGHIRLVWSELAGAEAYHVYRNGARIAELDAGLDEYLDLQAPAATISAGEVVLVGEPSPDFVLLEQSGGATLAGEALRYTVHAIIAARQEHTSNDAHTSRTAGALTAQWQRSLGDNTDDFVDVESADSSRLRDFDAPAGGVGRHYRVRYSATGAQSVHSNSVRGFKKIIVHQISSNGHHSCAVKTNGEALCWGLDGDGESRVVNGQYRAIETGWKYTCGLRTDDTVVCWGRNDYSQAPPRNLAYTHFVTGDWHTCGIEHTGSIVCRGRDDVGQAQPPEGEFISLSAGYKHACAIRTDKTLVCWGDNDDGIVDTAPEGEFEEVSVGSFSACARRADGTLACWGSNESDRTAPPPGNYTQVSIGRGHGCAVRTDKTLSCWGYNFELQATPPAGEFRLVSSGERHSCGVKSDGQIVCWGDNEHGQLAVPQ
ncbi:MAG: hypothetical protein H0U74_00660 [Bradymonadaceae bacterium]|nr:hypothetical protein [Lujinxingiaceae bacterium]